MFQISTHSPDTKLIADGPGYRTRQNQGDQDKRDEYQGDERHGDG